MLTLILALQFNEAFERQKAMTHKPTLPNLDDLVNKYKIEIVRGVMEANAPSDHALIPCPVFKVLLNRWKIQDE